MKVEKALRILSLSPSDCCEHKIESAYRKASLLHHPDRPNGDKTTFHNLDRAKELLLANLQDNERILYLVLRPSIVQVHEGKYHIMKLNGQAYHVPLWHTSLVDKYVHISILPALPRFIKIDESREMHVDIQISPHDTHQCLNILGMRLAIPPTETNTRVLKLRYTGCGVPSIVQKKILEKISRHDLILNVTYLY